MQLMHVDLNMCFKLIEYIYYNTKSIYERENKLKKIIENKLQKTFLK